MPFTGDDILQFFDTIIRKIQPIGEAKPGPNETMLNIALRIHTGYGIFTWLKRECLGLGTQYELYKTTGNFDAFSKLESFKFNVPMVCPATA